MFPASVQVHSMQPWMGTSDSIPNISSVCVVGVNSAGYGLHA